MVTREARYAEDIAKVHPDHEADAVNLTHYLALRQGDERSLQRSLGQWGLSSLGRCEPHVLATVESVRSELDSSTSFTVPPALSFEAGRAALDRNTDALFGPRPRGRVPRIMVTLPSEAASDYELVRRLVTSGMDVARVNGAHDTPAAWEEMVCNVRKASEEVARRCRISMDLPGPKLRTGPLVEGPRVLRLRPERDLRGVAVAPRTGRAGGRRRIRWHCAAGPSRPRRLAGTPQPGGRDRLGRHPRLAPTSHGRGVRAGPGHRRVVGHHVHRDRSRAALRRRRHSGGHVAPDPAVPPAVCRRPARSDHGARTRRALVARPAGNGPDRLHASGRLRRGPPGTACRAGRRKVDGCDRTCRSGGAGRQDRDRDGPRLQAAS